MAETKISIRNLYKIFGPDDKAMMAHVRSGIGKQELLETYNHVLGLKDINIDIKAGEITVIMGLSGSGKSTLIRHVNRLIEPTDGEILYEGTDLMKLNKEELRHMRQTAMSMVFQKFALLPHKNVLDNTALAPQIRGDDLESGYEEARKWISRVGLGGFEYRYPNQLSGGMQQRVGLARALTSNSAVMLMDEAYSALDPLIRTDMQDLLLELQSDLHKTVIFITHDLDEALKLADHLVILKDGYIVQQGEPQQILLYPNDPYIEDFVSDINRARVLKVSSIMEKLDDGKKPPKDLTGTIEASQNLESVIALSGGDTNFHYLVEHDKKPVGVLHMKDLVKALVPRVTSSEGGVR